jgi:alkyl hydroperoxide reductase subunit AhpC
VLGVSVDSVHSHKAYASQLGVSFPLLADFHPHGEVTRRYGLWRADRGLGKRATFIIDTEGIVRWNIVYPTLPADYEHLFEAIDALKR